MGQFSGTYDVKMETFVLFSAMVDVLGLGAYSSAMAVFGHFWRIPSSTYLFRRSFAFHPFLRLVLLVRGDD